MYSFSFFSLFQLGWIGTMETKKHLAQAKIRIGTLSCRIYNCKKFCWGYYTDCSWKATTTRLWRLLQWFRSSKSLPKMDKEWWYKEKKCIIHDWYRQADFCCVPLAKQFLPQRYSIHSEIDRKPDVFGKLSILEELHWLIFQAFHCTGGNNSS